MQANNKRILYLVIGAAAMLMAGVLYTWSILKSPFISEFGWNEAQLSANFTITMWSYCLSGIVSGMIVRKYSSKPVIIVGALMSFAGFYGASCITGTNPTVLYLWYGLVAGAGIGFVYNSVVVTVSAWFPEKKGMCSGILMMGFGGSTLLLGNLANYLFQVDAIGWRLTYRIYAVAIGAVVLLAGLVLKMPEKTAAKKAVAEKENDCSSVQMLKKPTFWQFYLYFLTLCAVGSTVINLGKDMALSVGMTSSMAAFAVGLMSLFNGAGRVVSGLVYDKFGRRKTMVMGNVLEIFALVFITMANLGSSAAVIIVGFCLAGMSYGFSPTITASAIGAYFGEKHFSTNFSVTNTVLIPTSLVAGMAGSLYSKSGSYTMSLVMLFVLAAGSLVLSLSIKDRK